MLTSKRKMETRVQRCDREEAAARAQPRCQDGGNVSVLRHRRRLSNIGVIIKAR